MFAPPRDITAEVFARLPDAFRRTGTRPAWRPQEEVDCFLEGPCFDGEGNLFVTDIPYGRIFRIAPDGLVSLALEYDGWPNGLKIGSDGLFYIADHRRGLVQANPASGTLRVLVDRLPTGPLKGLNDLTFGRDGALYFSDQGETGLQDPTGRLVCLRPGGAIEVLLDNVPSPNGLVLNGDQSILFLAATRGNNVWRVPLGAPGSRPRRVGVFVQLSGSTTGGPDGLAMDADDNLAVSHVGLGSVWIFNRVGEPIYRIQSPLGLKTTNAAFCKREKGVLYITESTSGTVLRARLPPSW